MDIVTVTLGREYAFGGGEASEQYPVEMSHCGEIVRSFLGAARREAQSQACGSLLPLCYQSGETAACPLFPPRSPLAIDLGRGLLGIRYRRRFIDRPSAPSCFGKCQDLTVPTAVSLVSTLPKSRGLLSRTGGRLPPARAESPPQRARRTWIPGRVAGLTGPLLVGEPEEREPLRVARVRLQPLLQAADEGRRVRRADAVLHEYRAGSGLGAGRRRASQRAAEQGDGGGQSRHRRHCNQPSSRHGLMCTRPRPSQGDARNGKTVGSTLSLALTPSPAPANAAPPTTWIAVSVTSSEGLRPLGHDAPGAELTFSRSSSEKPLVARAVLEQRVLEVVPRRGGHRSAEHEREREREPRVLVVVEELRTPCSARACSSDPCPSCR